MQILVLAATEMEIAPFRTTKKDVDILIGGVGVPFTMYQLLSRLHTHTYDIVIQAGIGGAFSALSSQLGNVVVVQKDCFADLGIVENKSLSTLFNLGFADPQKLPYTDGWLVNEHPILKQSPLQKVTGITVNKISDDELQTELFANKFNAEVESMEGAALHFVCLQQNIPFIQLRAISNIVGDRDKANWKIKEAVVNLNNELIQLIENIQG